MIQRLLLLLVLCITINIAGQSNVYLNVSPEKIVLGNDFLERTISLSNGKALTTEIKNKRSGSVYSVSSGEFSFELVFAGIGPADGLLQNGDNPTLLTAAQMKFVDYDIETSDDKTKQIALHYDYEWPYTRYKVTVRYQLNAADPFMRKWLTVVDENKKGGIHFLHRLNVEDITFSEPAFSRGAFGQPVFCNDLYIGVEYPAVVNTLIDGRVLSGYVYGEKITDKMIASFPSILGAAPSPEKLEQSFLAYVEGIKVKGTRPFLLYNSWYDFRHPRMNDEPESIMNEKNVLHRIETFKKFMNDRYGLTLDAFVLDDGWDIYESIWDIDTETLPNKFTPFLEPLKKMNTVLGIWASPLCGYSNRHIRVNWAKENGYENYAEYLCFAGSKYKAEFEKKMVEYTKQFKLGYFKWDGFLLSCNEPNHGHPTGVYSRKALVDTYIHMMRAVRDVNPDIFINITVGSWLSPWWLQYSDCIWMQGLDYGYSEDVPSTNPRDKAITFRDAVLWDSYQKQQLLFPMSSLMTHGIIKGRLNFLGGKDESLASFTNEVMMYFGRGVTMWELYVSPDLLSDGEWESIAASVKWAKENLGVLKQTKMILGDPLKREVYGYLHSSENKGILLFRNPFVTPQDVSLKITGESGQLNPKNEYYVKIVYPYTKILETPLKVGEPYPMQFDGYEVVVAELIPVTEIESGLPIGIRYDLNAENALMLYPEAGDSSYTVTGSAERKSLTSPVTQTDVTFTETEKVKKNDNKYSGSMNITVNPSQKQARLAFLIEPSERLKDDDAPSFEIFVNGKKQPVTVEQENGKWFWVSAPLEQGQNAISYLFAFEKIVPAETGVWFFADQELTAQNIGTKEKRIAAASPPKPYPAAVKKILKNLTSFRIQ